MGEEENDLPDWGQKLWKELGKPSLEGLLDVHDGPLIDRKHGLRRDDLVEILLDARALSPNADLLRRGRLLATTKGSIELLSEDGYVTFIHRDVIVEIKLVSHLRPSYVEDDELLGFERADLERRTKAHEKVEKSDPTKDDAHVWG